MSAKKKIFAISGSTRKNSSNVKLLYLIKDLAAEIFEVIIFDTLDELPHFNPDLDNENPPAEIIAFRRQVSEADGVLICSPEYVFSLPGSLKNILEWCVSTTVFSHKPVGLVTASASGEKAQEQLRLIMKTLETNFNEDTELLIQGIKGKMNEEGKITNEKTMNELKFFIHAFEKLVTQK